MRVADEDRQLSAKEIESIILHKNRSHRGRDSEPITTPNFKADTTRIRAYVRKAGLPWTNARTALESLGLYADDHWLNAARVFFANPPALTLRCAVFATPTSSTIIDQHDFQGDILTLIEEAEKYILKNIRIGMRLEGLVRVDVPEIDREAFREAIINAFCHRDYRDPDEVRIAIYPDRVEVRNPGNLMEGLSMRSLKSGKVSSRRRNPLIADLLRRIHLIEAWGRGIPLILEKAPHVRFSQAAGIFITEFPRTIATADARLGAETEAPVALTETDLRILSVLKNEALGSKQLLIRLGYGQKTGNYKAAMEKLATLNLIERTLPEKPNSRLQKYRLTAQGRTAIT